MKNSDHKKDSSIVWHDNMSVSNVRMDQQHHDLVDIVNQICEEVQAGENDQNIPILLANLRSHVDAHFEEEENLFGATSYPDAARHRLIHRDLLEKISLLQEECASGQVLPHRSLLNFLHGWLLDHIVKSDRDYVPYLTKND